MDSFTAAFGPFFTAVAGAALAWILIRGRDEAARVPKRQADPAARRERFYRRSFESSPVGLAILTPQGQWMKTNERLRQQLGYSREEILGLTIRELTHSEDRKVEATHIRKLMRREIGSYALEKRLLCKDRKYRPFDVSMVRFQEENGGQDLWQMVVTPTSNGLSEAIVDRSVQLGDILAPVVDLAYIRFDDQGIIEDWNKGATRIFGYEKAEMIGRSRTSLYLDEEVWEQKPREDLRQAISDGRLECEGTRVGKDGVELRLKITIIPDVHEERVTGFLELARELDQARGVDQYRQSYERLKSITEERIRDQQGELGELRVELAEAAAREAALRSDLELRSNEMSEREAELRILTDAFRKELDRRRLLEASLEEAHAERDELGHRVEELKEREITIDADSALAEPTAPDWIPIERLPPADRLRVLAQEKQSGTLLVTSHDLEKRIFFEDGDVYSCTSNDPSMLLGELLLSDGVVSAEDHRKALEVHHETSISLGRILVLIGALDEQALELAMRRKTEREILDVLTWSEGRSLFVKGSPAPHQLVPVRLDVEQLLEEGLELEEPTAVAVAAREGSADDTVPGALTVGDETMDVGQSTLVADNGDATLRVIVPPPDPPLAPQNKSRRKRNTRAKPKSKQPEFVASRSKRSTKFHLLECPSAQKIKASARIAFGTKAEAVEHGLAPCKTCLG